MTGVGGAKGLEMPRQFAGAEERLFEAACAHAGRRADDALDGTEGLSVLLRALDHAPKLSAIGRAFTWQVLINTMTARIFALTGWRQRPDCLKKEIRDPVVITGIPRSGTTALHKVLSLDPQFQGVEHWFTEYPKPRPPRDTWPDDPDYQAVVKTLTSKQELSPGMRAKHFEMAEEVDECLLVLKQSFVTNFFGETVQNSEYDEWWREQDEGKVSYPWYADVLRLISADDDRRWLLKNPGHMWAMDALFACFPDARVIHTHRRPDTAVPSLCSIVYDVRLLAEGENADRHALGRRDVKVWAESVRRMLKARQKRPDAFIDMWHEDFNQDPIGVIRDLYKQLGLTLSAEVEATMRRGYADRPERKYGEHKYTLEMFGLTTKDIEDEFGNYVAQFELDRPRRT